MLIFTGAAFALVWVLLFSCSALSGAGNALAKGAYINPQRLVDKHGHGNVTLLDAKYNEVTLDSIEEMAIHFQVIFAFRNTLNPIEDYVADSFDCDDTAYLFRSVAKFMAHADYNPAVGTVLLDGVDAKTGKPNGQGHLAIVILTSAGLIYLDPISSYRAGKPIISVPNPSTGYLTWPGYGYYKIMRMEF